MSTIDELVEKIRELSHQYTPNDEISTALSKKISVPIIGPFAIGKNAVMDEVINQESDFCRVDGFTTRDRRPGEDDKTYQFLKHDIATLKHIIKQLEEGTIVQVAVHPSTGNVYGSSLESYPELYNLKDILTSAIDDVRALGFKDFVPIFLVANVTDWEGWVEDRAKLIDDDDFYKRLLEARESIQWALDNQDRITVLDNESGLLGVTATKVIDISKGHKKHHAVNAANKLREMHRFVSSLIEELTESQ